MIKLIKNKFFNKQFLIFGIIGFVSTAISQISYYIGVAFFSLTPSIASIVADLLPMPISYILNTVLTYNKKLNLKAALTFPLAYIPGIIANMLIVIIVVNILHFPKEVAKLISLPITIPMNFICVSFIINKWGKKGDN
ncbi:MAG: GtrA family protein [Anaerorhabdus sp.]